MINGKKERPLMEFLEECLIFNYQGGLLFSTKQSEKEEKLILKCDKENNCFKLNRETGEWEDFGYLYDPYSANPGDGRPPV